MKPLQIENRPIEGLQPSPWNVNVVSPEAEGKIQASIQRLGMFKPVLVRELVGGELQIIAGEHRWRAAKQLGWTEIPVMNLGPISDKKAKEISLVDNGRYGADDQFKLSELLTELGSAIEIAEFMPYSEGEIESIFSNVSIALDDLDLTDAEQRPQLPETPKAGPTHQIMRFKVPVGDVAEITKLIEKTMKRERFTSGDSLTNAGDALVHVCNKYVEAL